MLTIATRVEMLTPDFNECNSTPKSGTNNIYPYSYIDVNDRGHHLRITPQATSTQQEQKMERFKCTVNK